LVVTKASIGGFRSIEATSLAITSGLFMVRKSFSNCFDNPGLPTTPLLPMILRVGVNVDEFELSGIVLPSLSSQEIAEAELSHVRASPLFRGRFRI
jgi:hypothetical protein